MSRWGDADKAYQAHSAACGECQGAGVSLGGSRPRCEVGAKLWRAYQAAGRPPHFLFPPAPVHSMPMEPKKPRP